MSSLTEFNAAAAGKKAEIDPKDAAQRNGQVHFKADPLYPLALDHSSIAAAEYFGVMRARLISAHTKSGIRSVIITSPEKEEGKSLICTNLAISFGRLGRYRVLLVDGDMRVRGVTRLMGMEEMPGLAEYLEGNQNFEQVVHGTDFPAVSVAAAGNPPEENLPTLLEGPRWAQFLEQAKQMFDLIIIDSVPVSAPLADLELMSASCDGVLLVVHLRKTTREALAITTERISRKLLGLVLNNTEHQQHFDYYSYYYSSRKAR
ncbi:MAG TPA: CpsD/CapB family tyrosine-protein kinase [Terriglobales bacterium]|nr:CpsD/CapB family tyrosine-protein kinase [Terriglobales bacterium]